MIRIRRLFSGVFIYAGPWAMRFTRPARGGTYSNGSHWHSPWYRWREQDDEWNHEVGPIPEGWVKPEGWPGS